MNTDDKREHEVEVHIKILNKQFKYFCNYRIKKNWNKLYNAPS